MFFLPPFDRIILTKLTNKIFLCVETANFLAKGPKKVQFATVTYITNKNHCVIL